MLHLRTGYIGFYFLVTLFVLSGCGQGGEKSEIEERIVITKNEKNTAAPNASGEVFSNSEYQFELELPENWKGYTANVTSGADEGKILEFRLPTSDPAWSLPTFTALTIALSRNSEWDMNLAKFTTLISVNTGTTNDPAAIKCETDISGKNIIGKNENYTFVFIPPGALPKDANQYYPSMSGSTDTTISMEDWVNSLKKSFRPIK